jgi:hypothetical protein
MSTPNVVDDARDWIEIAVLCESFHTLPREGGVLDQIPKEIQQTQ